MVEDLLAGCWRLCLQAASSGGPPLFGGILSHQQPYRAHHRPPAGCTPQRRPLPHRAGPHRGRPQRRGCAGWRQQQQPGGSGGSRGPSSTGGRRLLWPVPRPCGGRGGGGMWPCLLPHLCGGVHRVPAAGEAAQSVHCVTAATCGALYACTHPIIQVAACQMERAMSHPCSVPPGVSCCSVVPVWVSHCVNIVLTVLGDSACQ